jgi:hypothetical protein
MQKVGTGGMVQVAQQLTSKHKNLSSNPSTTTNKTKQINQQKAMQEKPK